jgi:hypothetical protein
MRLDPKYTQKALKDFGEEVVKISKSKLKGNGDLKKSIDYDLQVGKRSFDLDFEMEEYGVFQDWGVQGAAPEKLPEKSKWHGINRAPHSHFKFGTGTAPKNQFKLAINGWMIRKGIAPRSKDGKFTSRKTMAFFIRRTIYLAGITPKKFFSDPFEQQYKKLPNKVVEAYGLDIENFMDFTLNKAG